MSTGSLGGGPAAGRAARVPRALSGWAAISSRSDAIHGKLAMARKTPEQLTKEFEGRKAKGLAKGGAAYWPNVLANAVLKLTAAGGEFSVAALIERVAQDGQVADPAIRAGAEEALARLRQAAARGAE